MALLQQWRDMAYDQQADKAKLQQFWAIYFTKEKDIYAELLKNPDELVRGTVKELAEKFGVDITMYVFFIDRFPGRHQRQLKGSQPDRGDGGGYRCKPRL